MTLLQNKIDIQLGFRAVTRRWAGAQGRGEFRLPHHFTPCLPARHALGLAWDGFERAFDRGQSAAQWNGIYAVILFRWLCGVLPPELFKQIKGIARVGFDINKNWVFGLDEVKRLARIKQAKGHGS